MAICKKEAQVIALAAGELLKELRELRSERDKYKALFEKHNRLRVWWRNAYDAPVRELSE